MKWFCNYFVQVIHVTSFCCSPLHNDCTAQGSLHCANVSRSSAPAPPPVLCPPPLPSCPLVADSEKVWVRNCNLTDLLATRRRLPNQQQGSEEFVTKRRGRQAGWIGWGHLTRKLPILWPRWQLTDSDSEFLGDQFKTYLVVLWINNSLFVTTFIALHYLGIQGKLSLNVTWDYIPGIGSHLRCVYLTRGPSLPYKHRPFRPKS